jgi:hypothetical protein
MLLSGLNFSDKVRAQDAVEHPLPSRDFSTGILVGHGCDQIQLGYRPRLAARRSRHAHQVLRVPVIGHQKTAFAVAIKLNGVTFE